jgi:hypothetical protein
MEDNFYYTYFQIITSQFICETVPSTISCLIVFLINPVVIAVNYLKSFFARHCQDLRIFSYVNGF